ncbi:uncharacterized protein FOMMEDRAFT_117023 [Fomitiporia mediterranea MF3/22]|uniref:uncharacterized protein n=1 Tax=Fomitiporia mediterranea (strain MF3/22) TaxID=694068 RepID=UPI0004407354|nr:uncharacterized protein FOMMEDRAFT_117023 [Fomitiporia mediterranea MF3/22]EJD08548.1 hypothetical protein FOMMEDRAFT_117023 [Fomitiporia mediterranea MF3/22]
MATRESVELNEAHKPLPKAIEAFKAVKSKIVSELIRERHHWDKHEPHMFKRAEGIPDAELAKFSIDEDLVLVRAGQTAYGTIIFGKIRLPAIKEGGEGYIHVRVHDPPNSGETDVILHSILTEEGDRDADGHPTSWNAIHTLEKSLDFFNE